MSASPPINERQRRFIAEYLVDLNATAAAKRVGYAEKTAHAQGHRLLNTPHIAAAIQAAMDTRAEKVAVQGKDVLQELAHVGFLDFRDAFHTDGSLLPIHEIPEHIARSISSVDVIEYFEGQGRERQQVGVIRKIRFADKLRALELLGKNLKLYTDKVEHSGSVSINVIDPYAQGADDE